MINHFILYLLNANTNVTHKIKIKPIDNILGHSWSILLKEAIDKNLKISEPDRIYALNDEWSKEKIVQELQERIDIVNMYQDNRIPFVLLSKEYNQDLFNKLHRFFEDFMHPDSGEPHNFYMTAHPYVKNAIREFNVLIHRYEQHDNIKCPKINVSIHDRPTRDMVADECKLFGWNIKSGDVTLKYCHHGKHLYDYWKDKDDHIGDKNILPQFKISSDFKIYFGGTYKNKKKKEFYKWMDSEKEFLNSLGIVKDDPMLTIGLGVVGKVVGDINKIKNDIYGITDIIKVEYE
jgi:hypothetical protein